MGKYFVIVTCWDDNKQAQVKHIAGQFGRYVDAVLFEKAYNEHYSSNARIVEEFELVNL